MSLNVQADNLVTDVEDVLQEEADDDLEMFRSQWKRELQLDSNKTEAASGSVREELQRGEEDIEQKARDLFMLGVESEQDGRLYEAISYYKKAEKLVPNIELQAYKYFKEISNVMLKG